MIETKPKRKMDAQMLRETGIKERKKNMKGEKKSDDITHQDHLGKQTKRKKW